MPGAIIYDGPSELDGRPIIVIAVWSSANRKTGSMLQTYIMRRDMDPLTANKHGEDYSICGDCQHKGTPTLDPTKRQAEMRSCYVVLGQGPTQVYRAFTRGNYPNRSHDRRNIGRGQAVRIGTYGDGAAVPSYVWDELLEYADTHTAYTHNGGDPARYMVSADNLAQAQRAWSNGYRTFRVVRESDALVHGEEIECPSSRGVQCVDCRLCGGTSVRARSIAIVVHGPGAKHFS